MMFVQKDVSAVRGGGGEKDTAAWKVEIEGKDVSSVRKAREG
jgi:hypothetical protein